MKFNQLYQNDYFFSIFMHMHMPTYMQLTNVSILYTENPGAMDNSCLPDGFSCRQGVHGKIMQLLP